VILVDQIRTIDKKRFDGKLGEIDMEMMEKIERALHLTLSLKN
jgi:mRNA-degrading endonuclease toxin of MazEF toxin-antitoxin module